MRGFSLKMSIILNNDTIPIYAGLNFGLDYQFGHGVHSVPNCK